MSEGKIFVGLFHIKRPESHIGVLCGRLNYIFGKRAHKDKRESARYNFDLCLRPQVICYESTVDSSGSIQDTSDIKYLLGMIEWVDRIQSYSWG
jgi:hypothetical protein